MIIVGVVIVGVVIVHVHGGAVASVAVVGIVLALCSSLLF